MDSEKTQPSAADQQGLSELRATDEQLTEDEQVIASILFRQMFPDLVRLHFNSDVKKATTDAVAALKAGLIALREASGRKP